MREKNDNVAPTTLTSKKVGWRKAGMLQQYHLAALHVTTWLGHLSSEVIATLGQPGRCLTSNEVFTDTHMPRTNSHVNMQNICRIKCSKHACLVRRSRSLARRSSRLLHLFRNLRQSRNGYYRENQHLHRNFSKYFSNKSHKKTRQNLKIVRKRITQKHLFTKML